MPSRALSVEELLARVRWTNLPNCGSSSISLNNQLGIILAHAELLEAKATDDISRSRAGQVVAEHARSDDHRQRDSPPRRSCNRSSRSTSVL